MNYFEEETNNKRLNDKRTIRKLDTMVYQNYLKNLNKKNTKESKRINTDKLEEYFSNSVYHSAVKNLSRLEKKIIYLSVCELKTIGQISRILKMPRSKVKHIRYLAISKARRNVERCRKMSLKKKGENKNEQ